MRRVALVSAVIGCISFAGAPQASADPLGCTSDIPENYQNGPGSTQLVTFENGDLTVHASNASYFVRATGGVVVQFVDCVG